MRVDVEPGIEPNVAGGRVDVQLLVEGVESEPVFVEFIDSFAPIDPGPASAVIEGAARSRNTTGRERSSGFPVTGFQ
jgi:hypothetical protein